MSWVVWIHVLGCMEFEYSFVWKLWEYGSLVLVYKVYIHGLEPSILCMVWVWELLNSFRVGLSWEEL